MPTFCSKECNDIICDFCKHYQFNGVKGVYVGKGFCKFHKENRDPFDGCGGFYCFKIKEDNKMSVAWADTNGCYDQELKWTSVKDGLPLQDEKYKDWPVIYDEFLVTVYPKNPDLNDDPEVMLLWFDNKNNYFSYKIGGENYDRDNRDWKVIAWMKKPKPFNPRKEDNL